MPTSNPIQESDTDLSEIDQAEIDRLLATLDEDLPDYSPCRRGPVSADDQTAEQEEMATCRAPAQESVAAAPDPVPAPDPIVRSPGYVAALAGWKEKYAEQYRSNWSALDDAWNGKRRREANAADRAEYAAERGGVVRRYVLGQHLNEGLSDKERRALMQKESKERNSPPRVRADLSKMTPEQKAAHMREKEREKKARQRADAKDKEAAAMLAHPDYGRF